MLRLRTTTSLSVLALALGIATTSWLSTLTTDWPGPPLRYVAATVPAATRAPPPRRRGHHAVRVVQARRAAPAVVTGTAQAASPELVPLSTPSDTTQPWYQLRGHLDGRVLLHVDIDGHGQVRSASLSQSSGDPILDEHALRSVRGWRFTVPVDQPDGFSGELPMRFSSRGDGIARVP